MKPPPLRYARPDSLEEALELLATNGDAKVLAGGQSLLPILNLRLSEAIGLVDLAGVPGLAAITTRGGELVIGALTRHRTLETSSNVQRTEPLLARAAREVGHLAIRNRGTIGGSLAHADPAAEWPLVAVTLNASVEIRSRGGRRMLAARDLFTGPLTTAMRAGEVLTEIRVPVPDAASRFGFQELCRRPGDFAIVAVACRVTRDAHGVCRSATIGVGGAHGTPLWIAAAGNALVGRRPDTAAIRDAAEEAARAVDPGSDIHASAEYRRRMTAVLTARALREACT